jgi:signal transduction histidine kinase
MRSDRKRKTPLSLREKALLLLEKRQPRLDLENADKRAQSLILELELHQIELELQNEELRMTQDFAQQSAERYMEFYDFAPFGYFVFSKEGEIIDLNLSGANLLGSNRYNLKKSRFDFFVTDETKPRFTLFLEKLFQKRTKETCELTLTPKNDEPIYVFLSGISLENAKQCIVNVVDITQTKIAQNLRVANAALTLQNEEKEKRAADLIEAKNKAQENDHLKAAFLANMSHEIKTPLTGLIDFLDLLKSESLTQEERQDLIVKIEKSRRRLINIAHNMTEISKIESGITEVASTLYNINEQLDYIYQFFKQDIEKLGMHFFLSLGVPFDRAYIKSDREKIFTVFAYLIKNAMKHSDNGVIELGYFSVLKDDHMQMLFFVRDTKIGTSTENMDLLFKHFDQVVNEQLRISMKAGLELSIARAYLELLGGNIWIESEFSQGSSFYFTLPEHTVTAMSFPDITLKQHLNRTSFQNN